MRCRCPLGLSELQLPGSDLLGSGRFGWFEWIALLSAPPYQRDVRRSTRTGNPAGSLTSENLFLRRVFCLSLAGASVGLFCFSASLKLTRVFSGESRERGLLFYFWSPESIRALPAADPLPRHLTPPKAPRLGE